MPDGDRLMQNPGVEAAKLLRGHMAARRILDDGLRLSAGQAADENFEPKGLVS
jgi:hypothetical protein